MIKKHPHLFLHKPLIICLTASLVALSAPLFAAEDLHTPVSNNGTYGRSSSSASIDHAENNAEILPFQGSGPLTEAARTQGMLAAAEIKSIQTLKPASPANSNIESVIDYDSRTRIYSGAELASRATALITFDTPSGSYYCTGWFYGPDVVATAGHCVHTGGSGGAWSTNVQVYPAYDAGAAPYGSSTAATLYSVTGWTVSGSSQYDYGVIKLNSALGNSTGWFGTFWQTASLNKYPSILIGYPGDKSPYQSQWMSSDNVKASSARNVFYQNDTYGGQSGSAVWQDRPNSAKACYGGPCAYAIHAYGYGGSGAAATNNSGTRINKFVFNNLYNWRYGL